MNVVCETSIGATIGCPLEGKKEGVPKIKEQPITSFNVLVISSQNSTMQLPHSEFNVCLQCLAIFGCK